MISVLVKRVDGRITQVTVSGHAGHAPKGEDIICAAVSVLAQTLFFSLQRLVGIDVKADVRDGYLSLALPLHLPEQETRDVSLLTESMLVGLDEINQSYPDYITVKQE